MIKSKRLQQIQEYVTQNKTVSIEELVATFGVSKNTIRRDIQWLAERGEIKKVYGGVAANGSLLVSFSDRQSRNQKAKEGIAELASGFVEDGDIIFIDSGTTTCEMLGSVKGKEITVITNNLSFIMAALPYDNLQVISIGGVLERKTNSFASLKEIHVLQSYNINKAFMASTGVSIAGGVTNASPLESEIKQIAVARSREVFLLVDHDKFDQCGLITYCNLDDIHYLVTDAAPGEIYRDYAKSHDIQIVIPGYNQGLTACF